MNRYYPIMIDLSGRTCLVVGGGEVATRKIESLLQSGAHVTVISPELAPVLATLVEESKITWHKEAYEEQDIKHYTLVVAATNQPDINMAVYQEVKKYGGWINICDRPDLCNFTVPSTIQRGKLIIAVSTSGASPGLSRKIRKEIEQDYGPAYAEYVDFLSAIRKKVLAQIKEPKKRKQIFRALLDESYVSATEEERYTMVANLLGE